MPFTIGHAPRYSVQIRVSQAFTAQQALNLIAACRQSDEEIRFIRDADDLAISEERLSWYEDGELHVQWRRAASNAK